jgi:hypothetical protein
MPHKFRNRHRDIDWDDWDDRDSFEEQTEEESIGADESNDESEEDETVLSNTILNTRVCMAALLLL